jgi:hypothetical protein
MDRQALCFTVGSAQRDYTEGWPLLTVETEVNGDSKKSFFLGWFIGLVLLVQEIFVLPWLL